MFRVLAERQRWSNEEIGLLITDGANLPEFYVAKPIEMRPLEPGERVEGPTLSLRLREAQELMDGLWACGLRPTEGSGSAGSLAATERHLRDMQQSAGEWMGLAKHLVKVVVPPRVQYDVKNVGSYDDLMKKYMDPKTFANDEDILKRTRGG